MSETTGTHHHGKAKRGERFRMTVTLAVTEPQALALWAMFKHWNRLGGVGASRMVSFYCDGDGDFHPHAEVSFDREVTKLTPELEALAVVSKETDEWQRKFDYDPIAWKLYHDNPESFAPNGMGKEDEG